MMKRIMKQTVPTNKAVKEITGAKKNKDLNFKYKHGLDPLEQEASETRITAGEKYFNKQLVRMAHDYVRKSKNSERPGTAKRAINHRSTTVDFSPQDCMTSQLASQSNCFRL